MAKKTKSAIGSRGLRNLATPLRDDRARRRLAGGASCAVVLAIFWAAFPAAPGVSAESGGQGLYLALTTRNQQPPPAAAVSMTYGPREQSAGAACQWWQLDVRAAADFQAAPLFSLRVLSSVDPLAGLDQPVDVRRYLLRVAGEVLEFRDRHGDRPLLPPWENFQRLFFPRRAQGSRIDRQFPQTGEYLGQTLMLHYVSSEIAWENWPEPRVLTLDPELLVGTARNFKDSEGRRLPQQPERQNYNYVPFSADDYRTMIEAGMNLFTVAPQQEAFVRHEPVFYLRSPAGTPPMNYPADLYRSNYLGLTMFIDEPTSIMIGDPLIHRTLKHFSDAATTIEKRTRAIYHGERDYGRLALERAWADQGVNFGDMRLIQGDFPTWETFYETAFYQMAAGPAGIVHEGRYQLAPFDAAVARFLGRTRSHSPRELLAYHFAFLRGATRDFGKSWGTSIYGQCDQAIAPLALTMAYDEGARYLWFWTSDHDHHVPWPEQLSLARTLRDHARANPRRSIRQAPWPVDVAIVIPAGYFLSLENLWWIRSLDPEGKNEASRRYQRLMRRALEAAEECFDKKLSFDVTVDDGRALNAYGKIVRVTDEE